MHSSFYHLVKNKLKFSFFLFTKLPAAFFSGVKLKEISEDQAVTFVAYKWFTTNPFRSTYFACLAMAAEMSTGLLAMAHIHDQSPGVSMLVQKMEAVYHKKAVGRSYFTCNDGKEFEEKIRQTKTNGSPQTVTSTSIGKDEDGNLIAEFVFTWALKRKG